MKFALLAFLTLGLFNIALAQHDHGSGVSPSKLLHDASHRIGKLVDTGKIDENYVSNLTSLEIQELDHSGNSAAMYKVIATVGSGANKLELSFDMKGKFLAPHKITSKGEFETSPWKEKPGSELMESAMHFVTEATNTPVDLAPYVDGLKIISLKQNSDDSGVSAVVTIASTKTPKRLEIILSAKGDVKTYSLVD